MNREYTSEHLCRNKNYVLYLAYKLIYWFGFISKFDRKNGHLCIKQKIPQLNHFPFLFYALFQINILPNISAVNFGSHSMFANK